MESKMNLKNEIKIKNVNEIKITNEIETEMKDRNQNWKIEIEIKN